MVAICHAFSLTKLENQINSIFFIGFFQDFYSIPNLLQINIQAFFKKIKFINKDNIILFSCLITIFYFYFNLFILYSKYFW